jgi:hypothetical protein
VPIAVEAAHQMGSGERYHAPLRRIFDCLYTANKSAAMPLEHDFLLQTAFWAMNTTVGSNGLILVLLAFGALPKLHFPESPSAAATLTTRQRLQQIAMDEHQRYVAERRLSTAQNGSTPASAPTSLKFNEEVLVWRPMSGKPTRGTWCGGYKFLCFVGRNVLLSTRDDNGRARVSTHAAVCVRRRPPDAPLDPTILGVIDSLSHESPSMQPVECDTPDTFPQVIDVASASRLQALSAAWTELLTSTQDISQELLNAHAVQLFCSQEDASVLFSSEEFSLDGPSVFRDLNANWWEENASFDKHFPLDSFAPEIIAAHDPRAALFGPACRNEVAGLKANGNGNHESQNATRCNNLPWPLR